MLIKKDKYIQKDHISEPFISTMYKKVEIVGLGRGKNQEKIARRESIPLKRSCFKRTLRAKNVEIATKWKVSEHLNKP